MQCILVTYIIIMCIYSYMYVGLHEWNMKRSVQAYEFIKGATTKRYSITVKFKADYKPMTFDLYWLGSHEVSDTVA